MLGVLSMALSITALILRLLGLEEAARWVSFSLAIVQLVKEIIALIVTIIEIITVFITASTIVTVVLAVVGALLQVLFTLLNIVASGIIAVVMFFIMVDLADLNPTSSAYGYAEAAIWTGAWTSSPSSTAP